MHLLLTVSVDGQKFELLGCDSMEDLYALSRELEICVGNGHYRPKEVFLFRRKGGGGETVLQVCPGSQMIVQAKQKGNALPTKEPLLWGILIASGAMGWHLRGGYEDMRNGIRMAIQVLLNEEYIHMEAMKALYWAIDWALLAQHKNDRWWSAAFMEETPEEELEEIKWIKQRWPLAAPMDPLQFIR